jgi:hypothetical protein
LSDPSACLTTFTVTPSTSSAASPGRLPSDQTVRAASPTCSRRSASTGRVSAGRFGSGAMLTSSTSSDSEKRCVVTLPTRTGRPSVFDRAVSWRSLTALTMASKRRLATATPPASSSATPPRISLPTGLRRRGGGTASGGAVGSVMEGLSHRAEALDARGVSRRPRRRHGSCLGRRHAQHKHTQANPVAHCLRLRAALLAGPGCSGARETAPHSSSRSSPSAPKNASRSPMNSVSL